MSRAGDVEGPAVTLMNLQIANLGTSYPDNTGDSGLLAMIRCYYHVYAKTPRIADFTTYAKEVEDYKNRVFGPFVVRGPSRTATRTVAILQFLRHHNLLSPESKEDAVDGFTCGTRHVHFVGWSLDKVSTVEKLRKKMYESRGSVYRRDFAVVADYPREEGWSVCRHAVADLQQVDVHKVLEQHATVCLGKPYLPGGDDEGVSVLDNLAAERRKWHELPMDTPRADTVPIKTWVAEHPYFRRCTYDEKTGVIVPSKHELARLDKPMLGLWKKLQKKTLQNDGWETLTQFVQRRIQSMFEFFHVCGYSKADLALCSQWSFYEMLKAALSPPLPMPVHSCAQVPVQALDEERQRFAAHVRDNLFVVEKPKPRDHDTDVLLVMNLTACGETLAQLLEHASVPYATHPPNDRHPDATVGTVQGRADIARFAHAIADACTVPEEFVVAPHSCKEDAEQYASWVAERSYGGAAARGGPEAAGAGGIEQQGMKMIMQLPGAM